MYLTVHEILFRNSYVTNLTNMPGTNDTKIMFLEIVLAPNIVHSKDNEIA